MHILLFYSGDLPDSEKMLHAEAYRGNADPADEPHENGFAACFNKLYNMGIEADGRHCHDDEKLTELLERPGDEGRQVEHRRDNRGEHKKQDKPGKYFFEAECGAACRVQLFFLARAHESENQRDWNDGERTRKFYNRRLVERITSVNPIPCGGRRRYGGGVVDCRTREEAEAFV